jgi:hypothetical protein
LFESPGAALPSSHVAVAVCTVYFSFRYLPRIRYLHLIMAILLCGSTVYCRYHYVVDVLRDADRSPGDPLGTGFTGDGKPGCDGPRGSK